MSENSKYFQLNADVVALNCNSVSCRNDIFRLRREMDSSCDSGQITISQWRTLLERISEVQALLVEDEAQSWRHPRFDDTTESKKA